MTSFTEYFPGKREPDPEIGTEILLQAIQHLDPWRIRSVPAFRSCLLGEGRSGMMANPIVDWGTNEEVFDIVEGMRRTIREGRLIDFGHIPNEMLKAESLRARAAFEENELMMPFRDWVALSSWEGGHTAYFFIQHPNIPRAVVCIEIYGLSIPTLPDVVQAHDSFILYDGCAVETRGLGNTVIRPFNFVRSRDHLTEQDDIEAGMRGANSLDPLVTFLRFINDAGCPVHPVKAPEKLNKARAKKGKAPIPAHFTVPARDYITRLRLEDATSRMSQNGHQGGSHASPTPHWRRAHKRLLPSGKLVPVRQSKVNFRSVDEMHRLFYTVKLGGKMMTTAANDNVRLHVRLMLKKLRDKEKTKRD